MLSINENTSVTYSLSYIPLVKNNMGTVADNMTTFSASLFFFLLLSALFPGHEFVDGCSGEKNNLYYAI